MTAVRLTFSLPFSTTAAGGLRKFNDDISEIVASLVIYCNCTPSDALASTLIDANRVFNSKCFDGHKKQKEIAYKYATVAIDCLNNVIKGLGILGKIIGKRR